jgi:hypothetical protein
MKTNGYKSTKAPAFALRAISEEDALAPSIAEKNKEFVEKSAEVYTKG